jgi:hypothetical protein
MSTEEIFAVSILFSDIFPDRSRDYSFAHRTVHIVDYFIEQNWSIMFMKVNALLCMFLVVEMLHISKSMTSYRLTISYDQHLDHALECRTCDKNDSNCLLAQEANIRVCPNENDLCYAWFDRTGTRITTTTTTTTTCSVLVVLSLYNVFVFFVSIYISVIRLLSC